MSGEQVIFALHLCVALLLIGLGWPLTRNLIPPNRWYGFRTPATLREERIWYPVNQFTGRWLMGIGAAMAPVVVATFLLGLPVAVAASVNSIPVLGLFVMALRGLWMVHRLKRDQPGPSEEHVPM